MATHDVIWPEMVRAVHGEKFKARGAVQGSFNYLKLSLGTSLIVDPSKARQEDWLELLANEKAIGHGSHKGPKGVACEQGAPGMHWTFTRAAEVGVLLYAAERDQLEVAVATQACLLREVGLNRAFRWGEQVILPSPRVKDEKKQTPNDGYRNVFTKLALGEKVKKSAEYWAEDQALAVATMRELVKRGVWGKVAQQAAKSEPVPHLYLPIIREDLEGGGYVAYIKRTPEATAAMGRDCLHYVRCSPEGCVYRYDWSDEDVPLELKPQRRKAA